MYLDQWELLASGPSLHSGCYSPGPSCFYRTVVPIVQLPCPSHLRDTSTLECQLNYLQKAYQVYFGFTFLFQKVIIGFPTANGEKEWKTIQRGLEAPCSTFIFFFQAQLDQQIRTTTFCCRETDSYKVSYIQES